MTKTQDEPTQGQMYRQAGAQVLFEHKDDKLVAA